MAESLSYPGAPRWVKMSAIVIGVLVLLLVIRIHMGGGHNTPFAGGLDHHQRPESGHR